jgi:hypothetical protein
LHTAAISTSFLEENGMTREDHPQYSPDSVPFGFYLFGHIKSKLSRTSFDEGGDLLSSVEDNSVSIEKST